MTPDLTTHGHYYLGNGTVARHFVTAGRMRGRSSRTVSVCGRELRRAVVWKSEGHRHFRDWLDRYGDELCRDCVRRVTGTGYVDDGPD